MRSEAPVEWMVSTERVDYEAAVSAMDAHVADIRAGTARERVWLLEHPPLYTAGTSATDAGLVNPGAFPVYRSLRGGQHTYHGPGQRVAYVMLDLETRRRDIRAFVYALEDWIIDAIAAFGLRGERRDDRVGVWINRTRPGEPLKEDKIAAIGVRVRRWVSFHGIALNVEPDLTHFAGIVPCGIAAPGLGVTSLVGMGIPATLDDADAALRRAFEGIFGPTLDVVDPPARPGRRDDIGPGT